MTREITRRGGLIEAGELLDEIRRFCREQGMAESTFGRRAVNDGKFVGRIRDGARINGKTLKKVEAFMSGSVSQLRKPFVIGEEKPVEGIAA